MKPPCPRRTRGREQDAVDLEEMLVGLESARYQVYFGERTSDADAADADTDEERDEE